MAKYAQQTRVPIERSKAELERLLTRYGARRLVTASLDEDGWAIQFTYCDWVVRFKLSKPDACSAQEERRLWRALVMIVKAKLEAVESGISTFEREFLADIVIPSTNETVSDWMLPRWDRMSIAGKPLPALPME